MNRHKLLALWGFYTLMILQVAACGGSKPFVPHHKIPTQADMNSDSPDSRTMDRSSTGAVEDMDARVLERDPLGCTWVESKATVSFGEHDTKHQAHAQAVSEARAKALHRFLGVNVQQRFFDFQQESSLKGEVSLTERLLRVTQPGRILREHTLWSGLQDLPGCMGCRYGVHIRACILPEPERNDKEFSVNLSLKRTTLVDGDEATIEVTSTRDAYVYLYSVDMDWNAVLIFPNDYVQDNYVKAAQVLMYPSEEINQRGIKVVALLPVGASVSAEMIRVIASKIPLSKAIIYATEREHEGENLPVSSEIHGQGSFLTLMRQLNRTDTEWVEDAQAFTVHKR